MFEEIFAKKKIVTKNLFEFGFSCPDLQKNLFLYETEILHGDFSLLVKLDTGEEAKPALKIDTCLTEKLTGEEYILYKTQATGAFIGEVRQAVEDVLREVSEKCAIPAVFTFPQTQRVIEYVRKTYGNELEFLWEKFEDNAVWRRQDSQKWYAAVLTTSRQKLGLAGNEKVEIIDLRIESEKMEALLKNPHYFAGWHMNKKHWFTVILDSSVSDEELFMRIDESYRLAVKGRKQ